MNGGAELQCNFIYMNKRRAGLAFRLQSANLWDGINKIYWTTQPFILLFMCYFYGTKIKKDLEAGHIVIRCGFPDVSKGTCNTENSQPGLVE